MRIAIGSDHAGFELKEFIKKSLLSAGYEILDFGTNSCNPVDYPVFAKKVCLSVINQETTAGILICGTGIGMSISANKIKGIRAALCSEELSARLSRLHNNANVLCLGARIIGTELALSIVKAWLSTPFEGGRHQKRVEMIEWVAE
ncbi:MAG: ribose 5-phosphate isomerase B [Aquificaceae bacterium]|nr:ribose 5-phosphate isomerase B [Aquificaceae bacterium]